MSFNGKLCVAVASGKGGTGKTTIAANLAHVAASTGCQVSYLDCDVEEPNGHIFLKPVIEKTLPVSIPVPKIDESKCTVCGKCKEICQYNAIAVLGKTVLIFPNLCHGCGGCKLVCPTGAISEEGREIGCVEEGTADGVRFVHGRLKVGEAMSPPIIRKVKQMLPDNGLAIIDAPPGTSCPVIQSVRGTDYVILVTEPTPFGLYDLRLAIEMLKKLGLAFGVVVNRADIGDNKVFEYCRYAGIDILLSIPNDRQITEAYSRGLLVADKIPYLATACKKLLEKLFEYKETITT